jgi:hypothetical protein
VVRKSITKLCEIALSVRAGGRCEFRGCNKYLLEHGVTHLPGNFAQRAHIVAFKKDGPRGKEPLSHAQRNELNNLMLLCAECHKHIDDNPAEYPVSDLRKQKTAHEQRIRSLTRMQPDLQTTVLVLKTRVASQSVEMSHAEIQEAVAPRYPGPDHCVIDLTNAGADSGQAFFDVAKREIAQRVDAIYKPGLVVPPPTHVSVFALAPIPLLMFLGSKLSSKVPTAFYQRHRDTQDWKWKVSGEPAVYVTEVVRKGTDPSNVALLVSVSGKIPLSDLPSEIDGSFSLYEITLADRSPSPDCLRIAGDLEAFRAEWQQVIRRILRDHEQLDELRVFPAIPAPVAIVAGRELLPKIDPVLIVYDCDRVNGGFTQTMRINDR